jgi:hypothetical protein
LDHKAFATCAKGHSIEFGSCRAEIKNFNGKSIRCVSTRYIQISPDEVQCVSCKSTYRAKTCPVCNIKIPVKDFRKLYLKL